MTAPVRVEGGLRLFQIHCESKTVTATLAVHSPPPSHSLSCLWCCSTVVLPGAISSLCRTTAHTPAQHDTAQHDSAADPCAGSHNWAADSSSSSSSSSTGAAFALPLYVVFCDADYDVVWNEYAWEGPPHTNPWFKMDLSKPGGEDGVWGRGGIRLFVLDGRFKDDQPAVCVVAGVEVER